MFWNKNADSTDSGFIRLKTQDSVECPNFDKFAACEGCGVVHDKSKLYAIETVVLDGGNTLFNKNMLTCSKCKPPFDKMVSTLLDLDSNRYFKTFEVDQKGNIIKTNEKH